jgi:hypothetical protein
VFDSIREVSENNKYFASSNKEEILKAVMDQRRLEEKVENELKAVIEVSDNVKESFMDLKARSMRDNLIFSWFFRREMGRHRGYFAEFFFTKEVQT